MLQTTTVSFISKLLCTKMNAVYYEMNSTVGFRNIVSQPLL